MKGERVCFDIILVNNGTLPYIPDIIISDWFDSGLIYDGYELMPDLNGNRWDKNYFGVGTWYDDLYGYRFI